MFSCFQFLHIPMESFSCFIFFCVLISSLVLQSGNIDGIDTISQHQIITDGQTLVSSGQTFELGFFSPVRSTNRYLGIWYKKVPRTIVWVANREIPLVDPNGTLTISSDGSLMLLSGNKSIVWSSNTSGAIQANVNVVAQLLDSGNLVLGEKEDFNAKRFVWQSFDYPSDTLLPGMKLGTNFRTGHTWYLASWKSESDPSVGELTYKLDGSRLPRCVLRRRTEKIFSTGPWNGERFSGFTRMASNVFLPKLVFDDEEVYFAFELVSSSVLSRFMLNVSGVMQRSLLNEEDSEWTIMYPLPYDLCLEYGKCGPNGICRIGRTPICECLDGFVLKSQREWDALDWSGGCRRRTPLDSMKGEGFIRLRNVKLPDLVAFKHNKSMNATECERECLIDYSCSAFTNPNVSTRGSDCLMWFGDLIDIREIVVRDSEQDIYLRLPASEMRSIRNRGRKRLLLTILTPVVFLGLLLLCFVIWCIYQRRKKKRGLKTNKEDIELPLFEFEAVTAATNNFSSSNLLGEGGFGAVYKGQLSSGVEVAVKRLSRKSRQGLGEFKNETTLISSLQHRNLVSLLGCCLDRDERILIYEYMPNRSLDYFIFDPNRKKTLTWENRFEVAMGISRALLYLHQDSRLRIIHRDLKASNVLLDSELNPKISDFGIAKTFGGDQIEGKTKRVIGTHGYMSPEYTFRGTYSVKSDVFSLGVLLLELVSGRRNRILDLSDQHQSLLGHAWLLWKDDKALELMDDCLKESFVESQVLKCIQVALLCTQQLPKDRPTTASVVLMLSNEAVELPQPKHPGFFSESKSMLSENPPEERFHSGTAITITMREPR